MMSNDQILNLVYTYHSGKKLNLDGVDLEPYVAQVRAKDAGITLEDEINETNKTTVFNYERTGVTKKEPILEEPKKINKGWTKDFKTETKEIVEEEQEPILERPTKVIEIKDVLLESPKLICQKSFLNPFRKSLNLVDYCD